MMKGKIFKNWPLKILALVASFVIWFIVIQITDPQISTTLDIPVEFINEENITDSNRVITKVAGDKVKIKVTKERSTINKLTVNDFKAVADYAKMKNDTQLPVTVVSQNSKISNVDFELIDSSIEVTIESVEKITRVVEYEIFGEPGDGYVVGDVSISPSSIDITCPQSQVQYIKKAIVNIDVSGITSSQKIDAQVRLFDGNDEEVEAEGESNIKLMSNGVVSCNVELKQISTVNLAPRTKAQTVPAPGFAVTYKVEPTTIKVFGDKNAISALTEIPIDIDVTGLNATTTKDIDIRTLLPEGVEIYKGDSNVKVTVEVTAAQPTTTTAAPAAN